MKLPLVVIIYLVLVAIQAKYDNRYSRYLLYNISPQFPWQLITLSSMRSNNQVMLWNMPSKVGSSVQIMVAPQYKDEFEKTLNAKKIGFSISIYNIQRAVQNLTIRNYKRTNVMTWDSYYSYKDIVNWLEDLVKRHVKANLITIGTTEEGKDIKLIHIPGANDTEKLKKAVFVEAGSSPRDWIGTATANYLISELLEGRNMQFSENARTYDWYILPVLNPDGYEYTFTQDRFWIKNRAKPHGVYLNRNWDFMWLAYGSDSEERSDLFAGKQSFSEKETKALSHFLRSVKDDLGVYLSLQAYGQKITIPYGYTEKHVDNYDAAHEIAKRAVTALSNLNGIHYTIGNPPEVLYHMSGTSEDWVKHNLGTPLVYTYYLRDRGQSGYLLPTSEILPNCKEVLAAIGETLTQGEKMGVIMYSGASKDVANTFLSLLIFLIVLVAV